LFGLNLTLFFFIIPFQPKATPEGQAIFDKLLKACGEVVWDGDSILVSKLIQVDPPYTQESCKIVSRGSGADATLERVKKIVASVGSGGGSN